MQLISIKQKREPQTLQIIILYNIEQFLLI